MRNWSKAILFGLIFGAFWANAASAQVATLSNTTIPFGNVAVGATSTKNLTITNTGTSNLVITSITVTGSFTSSNCGSATISPSHSCVVSVSFTPSALGSYSGTLTVTDNDPSSPQVVTLSGTGVASATINPASLTFPNQAVGTSSLPKTVTLTNNQAIPLNISSVTASGPFTAGSCPASLAAQTSCVISITFTPTVLGSSTGTLTVVDDANNSPQTASLTGSGVQPVTFSVTSLNFGSQVINTTSAAKTVTLTNSQSVPLNISSITASAYFSASSCTTPIAAYGSCAISVTFTPSVLGSITGTLTVTDDANTSPQTLTLMGTGSSVVSLSPSTLQFATSQVVGTTSPAQAISLINNQSTALSVTSVSTTGPFSASSCPASVAVSASCVINVTFTPTVAGHNSGTLTVTDSAGQQTATLQGTGTAVALTSITVTPANPSSALGTTTQFTATGSYNNGTTATITPTWASSNTSIATISSTGLATTVATGSTTISATSSGITGSTTLTVNPPALVSIAVTPANSTITSGTSEQLTATGTYTNGSTSNLTSSVTWTSSNSSVATISSTGLASSSAVGTVSITASLGSISGSTNLTISSGVLSSIAVTPANPSVSLSATQQFTATGTYADGTTQNLTSTGVTWSAGGAVGGNSTVGTISSAGLYQAPSVLPSPAQVTITATSTTNSSIAGLTAVTLTQISVSVSPSSPLVEAAMTFQFTATVTGSSNTGVTWSAGGIPGGNSTVGTISSTGLYTAPATIPNPAQVTITATSVVDGVTSGSTTLTVVQPITVTITPTTQNVHVSTTQQFTATVTGGGGLSQAVTWSAGGIVGGNVIVGTISSSGLYTAPALVPQPALVTITATSVADPSKKASAVATVIVAAHVTVTVSPETTWVVAGASLQFQGSVWDSSNLNVIWSVNGVVGGNSTVGTISSTGLYTAPSVVPNPAQLVVTATSVADPTESGNSNVTVGAGTFSATPLIDFTAGQLYLGQFSGLLYNGSNSPPPEQVNAGVAAASLVQPLDANGNPNPTGKIVLVSLGMSNGWDEWCDSNTTCVAFSFMGQVASSTIVNHSKIAVVDGAYPGETTPSWACAQGVCPAGSTNANNYDRVRDTILTPAGLTEAQIQVVWIKQSNPGGYAYPSLPSSSADAYGFEYQLGQVLRALKTRWPNIQQVFISSRIYAGYSNAGVNPEPYAYEYGFSVKWLINDQITQRDTGMVDPLAGDLLTAVPWIDWGPYIWGDGTNNPPGSTALTWAPTDFASDGEHPGNTGITKVGNALMNFFLTSPYTVWFSH